MSDLISRQAAIEALDERCDSECEYSKKQRSIMCDACYLGSAKEVIEALPTIDPVKHGKWLKIVDLDTVQCSECFEEFDYIDGLCYLCHGQELPDYCPNCGARMERSEE